MGERYYIYKCNKVCGQTLFLFWGYSMHVLMFLCLKRAYYTCSSIDHWKYPLVCFNDHILYEFCKVRTFQPSIFHPCIFHSSHLCTCLTINVTHKMDHFRFVGVDTKLMWFTQQEPIMFRLHTKMGKHDVKQICVMKN